MGAPNPPEIVVGTPKPGDTVVGVGVTTGGGAAVVGGSSGVVTVVVRGIKVVGAAVTVGGTEIGPDAGAVIGTVIGTELAVGMGAIDIDDVGATTGLVWAVVGAPVVGAPKVAATVVATETGAAVVDDLARTVVVVHGGSVEGPLAVVAVDITEDDVADKIFSTRLVALAILSVDDGPLTEVDVEDSTSLRVDDPMIPGRSRVLEVETRNVEVVPMLVGGTYGASVR